MSKAFRNLRISIKMMLPLMMLALVALGIGGSISLGLVKTDRHYTQLLEREARGATYSARLSAHTTDLARLTWRAMAAPEPEYVTAVVRDIEGMAAEAITRATPLRATVAGTPLAVVLMTFERDFPVAQALALRGIHLLQEGRTEEGRHLLRNEFRATVDTLRLLASTMSNVMLGQAEARSAELTEEARVTVRNALLGLGIGLALSLALSVWLIFGTVVRPFARLHLMMQRLAGGDLAVEVGDTARGDEIGSMARALQGFASGLRDASTLRGEQEALTAKAEHDRKAALAGLADTLERRVGGVVDGIAAAASELNAAATSTVGIADATSGRAATVSNATSDASANVNTVAAATEQLAASVAEISRQVADSARMAHGAVEQANRTNATVANLTEAASRIGEVTRLIGDIAGQTNLLALNATIEAARAGEAGKGFAVVASEVKALANQTAQATGNIASQIQAMQAATREAATDIGAIRDSIDQINEVTAAIAAAVEEQGAATRDIAQNVQRAAAGTNEIAGAIEGVTAAASETGGAANQVQATSGTLAQQAETLKREVSSFLGQVRAA